MDCALAQGDGIPLEGPHSPGDHWWMLAEAWVPPYQHWSRGNCVGSGQCACSELGPGGGVQALLAVGSLGSGYIPGPVTVRTWRHQPCLHGLCAKGVGPPPPTRQDTSPEMGVLQPGTCGAETMAGDASGGWRSEGVWEEDVSQFRPEKGSVRTRGTRVCGQRHWAL